MISFRQNLSPMISEEQSDSLKCKICQKEFPRFDQRGFRNAGFTAHQNRCVEREYLLTHPVVDQQSSPRQRFLLPAPPISASSSSSLNSRVLVMKSNSSPPVIQQGQQQHRVQMHSYPPHVQNPRSSTGENLYHSQIQAAGIHYLFANAPPYVQNNFMIGRENEQHNHEDAGFPLFDRTDYSTVAATSEATAQNQLPVLPVTIHEMLFPITHCDYCDPEYGLHQSTCLFLLEFLRQSGSM